MALTIMDVSLILIIAGFAFSGFCFGLIHMIGSFVSILVAAIISTKYFDFAAEKLSFLFGDRENLGRIVTFIILFLIVTRLVGFVFWVINKLFNVIAILPFLKTFNRIGGALLGLIEGIVLTALAVFMLARYPLNDRLTDALANSMIVDYLLDVANQIAPLLPDVVNKAQQVLSM